MAEGSLKAQAASRPIRANGGEREAPHPNRRSCEESRGEASRSDEPLVDQASAFSGDVL